MASGAPSIHILPSVEALYRASAERLLAIGNAAIAERGSFHLALAGGTTPRGLYRQLSTPELNSRLDWSRVHLYFGDERCVPPDHSDSNYRMVRESLLPGLPQPPAAVHRIAGELPPAQAAADYARQLHAALPAGRFDLVLLGLGPDGHMASLFPGTAALAVRDTAATAVYVERLASWRISLTLPLLEQARHLMLLVAGAGKAEVVAQALGDPGPTTALPIQWLRPQGALEWYLDTAAASRYQTKDVS